MKQNQHSGAGRKTGGVNCRLLRPLAAFPLSLLLLLAVPGETRANIIQAASLALSDVQAAVNSANNGDTVVLPAGTANWANYCGVTNKGITIQGAGSALTVITNTQKSNGNTANGCVLIVSLAPNLMTRITGIGFDGSTTANGIYILGPEWGFFQVDNCSFAHFFATAIQPCTLTGLINSCTFIDDVMPIEVTPTSYQNDSFLQPLSLGTTNCVVTENCVFLTYNSSWYRTPTTGASFSQGNGSRTVFRYNTWTNFNTNLSFYPILDAHGNMLPVSNSVTGWTPSTAVGTNYGGGRGTRQFEVYGNLFVSPAPTVDRLVHLRGGTCLVYSNTYIGRYMNTFFYMQEEDGPSRWTNLVTYQGYDQHWLNIWANIVNGNLCTNVGYSASSDAAFILPGTNLFWSPTPLANPEMTSYTPLVYPHPLAAAQAPPAPPAAPTNLRILGQAQPPPPTPPPVTNVTSGLELWWTFDAGSGATAIDSSTNGNTGTLYGSPAWTTGIISNCLSFTGSSSQYCSIASAPVSAPPMTLCAWINTTSTGSNYIAGEWHTGGGSYNCYAISINAGNIAACEFSGNSGTFDVSPSTYNDGKWHHVAAVWSSSSLVVLYVDGNPVQTGMFMTPPSVSMQAFAVGCAATTTQSQYLTGEVDDVRLYNRALSAGEVANLYNLTTIW